MHDTFRIFTAILISTSGAWHLLRADRTRSPALACLGLSHVALGVALNAVRVNEDIAAVAFAVIAIALSLAYMLWRTPTVPKSESPSK